MNNKKKRSNTKKEYKKKELKICPLYKYINKIKKKSMMNYRFIMNRNLILNLTENG
jgi:hypothetical protein